MEVVFHKNFKKKYKKLPKKVQSQFVKRLQIFINDTVNPMLHLHSLEGMRSELWSINITGDYRALFTKERSQVIFQTIGTHSRLYS